jgi:exosome complex RNA-binding protein Rrp4
MLQCRTRNGKLEAGSLVYVPPHLIKRLKHHYHLLPCGVSIILGCNGNVWVAPPPKRTKADGDDKSIMSESAGDAATEVSLSTRETICRVRNAVSLAGSRSRMCALIRAEAWPHGALTGTGALNGRAPDLS